MDDLCYPSPVRTKRQEETHPQVGDKMADFVSQLSGFVTEVTQCTGVAGLTLSVVSGPETIYAEGFGLRDEDRDLPVLNTTLFAIGSTSKAFTSAILGLLSDDGALDLDSPVTNLPSSCSLPSSFVVLTTIVVVPLVIA
jgi:CubicO group peptidase (beta-lactamase class C family)